MTGVDGRARWRPRLVVAVAAAAILVGGAVWPAPADASAARGMPAVVLPASVRESIDSIFVAGNKHWNQLAEENQLAQMLGTGKPTQLEYMGCLRGRTAGDTVWVDGTTPARGMIRFQFAVTGTCDHVRDLVGTWHTHPYRAAADGSAIKERHLSSTDLKTFASGADRAVLAVWDVDSIDVAVRAMNGVVRHPGAVVFRAAPLP